jgi:hypothetical protein
VSRPIVERYTCTLDPVEHLNKTWDAAAHLTSCQECKARVPRVIGNMMAIIDRLRYRVGEWAPRA